MDIKYIDRSLKQIKSEQVYGAKALHFLYSDSIISLLFRRLISRVPLFSMLYGALQKCSFTRKKIRPFIKNFYLDPKEFLLPVEEFSSFNDFFIRKLRPESRPLSASELIIPADGRYYFYNDISTCDGWVIKGEKFSVSTLLDNENLSKEYSQGSMAIARLCPTDYHRFHFPIDCTPSSTSLVNGWLYSVNPIAIKKDIHIFTKNKRTICTLDSQVGKVLFMEIGATFVGSIHQTYTPGVACKKGDEKGYFSFGASSLLILFPPDSIEFDSDLIEATISGFEIRCLMGQSMGHRK